MEGVLGNMAIARRLDNGEIFQKGSWVRENLKAARYDIRIANDFMIIPDGPADDRRIVKYRSGKNHPGGVILLPGEVGFFSSMERFCMPRDLAGNIGAKTKFARQGVLVVTGMFIDPNFGSSTDDERTSFVIFNLGTSPVPISPGQSIASVQFFEVVDGGATQVIESKADAEQELFADNGLVPRFGLLKELATLRSDVRTLEHQIEVELREMNRELARVGEGASQVVLFGIFVLSATILGGIFTYFVGLLGNEALFTKMRELLATLPTAWPPVLLLIVVIFAVSTILMKILTTIGEAAIGLRATTHSRRVTPTAFGSGGTQTPS